MEESKGDNERIHLTLRGVKIGCIIKWRVKESYTIHRDILNQIVGLMMICR